MGRAEDEDEPLRARLRGAAAYARETADDAAEAARDALEEGLDSAHHFLKRKIKRHPGIVVGSAVAIGFVLGVLLSGRR